MKKLTILIAAMALVCFSVPAMAVDWNFYGSARVATFWDSSDSGDSGVETDGLQWENQTNSRLGATVKADHLSGRVELALKGTDGGDVDVGTRRIEGAWNFGAGKFMVQKGYTAVNQFLSGQVHAGDAGLLGTGFMYGGRPGGLGLEFGGFEVYLLTTKTDDLGTGGTVDISLPKLELAWGMAFDAFSFNVMGGAQTYKIKEAAPGEDVDVTSYVVGGDATFNFGPAYVKGAISYAQNGGNARWTAGDGEFDGVDDVEDTTTLQGGIVGGMKVSDMLTFELGGGYRTDDNDNYDDNINTWEIYGQSVIALAPGVYVIPEIGFGDSGDDAAGNDAGDFWYAGAKWQIDF
jgi:hypothetical protein